MVEDVLRTSLHVAQTHAAIRVKEGFDEILRKSVNMARPMDLSLQNLFVDSIRRFVKEGRIADKHLVAQHTAGPPVRGLAVTIGLDDFRCKVFGRPAEGPSTIVDNLRETKVG